MVFPRFGVKVDGGGWPVQVRRHGLLVSAVASRSGGTRMAASVTQPGVQNPAASPQASHNHHPTPAISAPNAISSAPAGLDGAVASESSAMVAAVPWRLPAWLLGAVLGAALQLQQPV